MPPTPVSRRAFLAGSAGALLAAATAGANARPAVALLTSQGSKKKITPAVLSSDLYATTEPQRFIFGTYRGPRPVSAGSARLLLAPPSSKEFTAYDTVLHKQGLPKGRGIYEAQVTLPVAGVWTAQAEVKGQRVGFAIRVKDAAEAPVVGSAAPTAASPTTTSPMGVDPLCTRRPACPLHDVSLADVIGKQPVAVMFATPALCQSMYCGPVLDQLLDVMEPYRRRGVQVIHVEIYESTRGATVAPTVKAWGLPSEPWLYAIDAGGVIRGRLDGAFATDEVENLLDGLVA